LLDWARAHLDQPLTVTDLADRAGVSPATLHRRFQSELGTTPLGWLTTERVALACRLLERGESGLDRIARRSGLGTATNLRLQLKRSTGLTPSSYRRRFTLNPSPA
jgi:AraC family transcriptional activator FtrA